jgi:hypothetical protein
LTAVVGLILAAFSKPGGESHNIRSTLFDGHYGTIFLYHDGAGSYYAGRRFRISSSVVPASVDYLGKAVRRIKEIMGIENQSCICDLAGVAPG